MNTAKHVFHDIYTSMCLLKLGRRECFTSPNELKVVNWEVNVGSVECNAINFRLKI